MAKEFDQKASDFYTSVASLMFEAYPDLSTLDTETTLKVCKQLAIIIGFSLAHLKMRTSEEMFEQILDKLKYFMREGALDVLKTAAEKAESFPQTEKTQEVIDAIRSAMDAKPESKH